MYVNSKTNILFMIQSDNKDDDHERNVVYIKIFCTLHSNYRNVAANITCWFLLFFKTIMYKRRLSPRWKSDRRPLEIHFISMIDVL